MIVISGGTRNLLCLYSIWIGVCKRKPQAEYTFIGRCVCVCVQREREREDDHLILSKLTDTLMDKTVMCPAF